MKASFLILLSIVTLVVIGFLIYSRLPDIIAHNLSKKMQVSVSIDDIKLARASIDIHDIQIGNPAGYTLPYAFKTSDISLLAPLKRYLDTDIVIDEITLDNIYLGLEFDQKSGSSGNWTTMMANYKKDSTPAPSDPARTVFIRKLILRNITGDIVYKTSPNKRISINPIDKIELSNVSSTGGIPMDQLSQVIFKQALQHIFSEQNLRNMLEGALDNVPESAGKYLAPLKGLLPSS